MEHFFIVTNDGKDKKFEVTEHVKGLLEQAGKVCTLCKKDDKKESCARRFPEDIDCAVVIGEDGGSFIVKLARALANRNTPILGIDMGTLGYLTEVEVGNMES